MIDWLEQLWDTLTAVSVPLLILALALQTTQTLTVGLAWRNILRSAYPKGDVRYRPVLGYYAGGVGLNAILPASAGTVAMLGLFRASIPGSTVAGVVGATVVQNIFFGIMAACVYLWLFLSVAGSFDVKLGWFDEHAVASLIIIVAGGLLITIVVKILWRKFKTTWENAKEGGTIVGDRRAFLTQVVAVEAVSYVARMGVNATYMYAFNIPVSVRNIFLIVAASSISSTVAIAPGAVGTQTALAQVVLAPVASPAAITTYSVGQAIVTTAWSAVFGLTMLARTIGWKDTRKLIHFRKKKDEEPAPATEG